MINNKCVVILSGGLDTLVITALYKQKNYEIHALSYDYGQKHIIEIEYAKKIAQIYDLNHKIVKVNLSDFTNSALTDKNISATKYKTINEIPQNITSTYVPARNIVFLSIVLSYAEANGIYDIIYGANKTDFYNYPDCRKEFYQTFEKLANIGTSACEKKEKFRIHAPLIDLEKKDIIELGIKLNVEFKNSFSCYNPSDKGYACGQCLSCNVRLDAFKQAKIKDEIPYVKQA